MEPEKPVQVAITADCMPAVIPQPVTLPWTSSTVPRPVTLPWTSTSVQQWLQNPVFGEKAAFWTQTMLSRFGNENQDGVVGKPAHVKQAAARAALGNISNKAAVASIQDAGQGAKDKQTKAGRVLTKVNATSSLRSVLEKENGTAVTSKAKETKECKKETKQDTKKLIASPAPMDISANSAGDAFSKQILPVNDIDRDDHDNPQLVSVYVNDIYDYLWKLERSQPIRMRYLEGREVNGRMRAILVDWLIQVHLRFHLLQETLYLTIAILDRFLQEQEVSRSRLQLVGVTSMLVASKYEEMYAPEIADFVYITDNAYSKADIRKMECLILKALDFQLGRPLPLHFLRRNSKAGEVDATKHTLAKYLMELTVIDYDMVHIHPSQIAAAALCLSIKILDNADWNETLTHYSKYSMAEVKPVIRKLAQLVLKADTGKLTAVKTKYQSSKFMRISTLSELKSDIVRQLSTE